MKLRNRSARFPHVTAPTNQKGKWVFRMLLLGAVSAAIPAGAAAPSAPPAVSPAAGAPPAAQRPTLPGDGLTSFTFSVAPKLPTTKPPLPHQTNDWNTISTATLAAARLKAQDAPLRQEIPFQGKNVTIEGRRYEPMHASPKVLLPIVRRLATQGLGIVNYDAPTVAIVVYDTSDAHARIQKYFRLIDTPRPARVYAAPKGLVVFAEAALKELRTAAGELVVFKEDELLILRDTEEALANADRMFLYTTNKKFMEAQKRLEEQSKGAAATPVEAKAAAGAGVGVETGPKP